MSLITVGLTFTQKSARVYLVCETADKGLRTFSWRLSGRIVAVSGREERERAVELYFTTSMSTKQVVEHLGYPTRQCPGTVAARRSQVCGCRPQAAHTVGDAVSRGGIVPVWYAAEAGGDGAWRQRRCGASLDETVPRRWNGGAGAGTEGCHAAGRNR